MKVVGVQDYNLVQNNGLWFLFLLTIFWGLVW